MGFLFVIDGTDGTGKNTQSKLLIERLREDYNLPVALKSFPSYGQPSAYFVEKYLNGDFGKDIKNDDTYLVSLFYAIDRAISFNNDEWGEVYRNNGIVICDRYFTSNIIHQGCKILKNNMHTNMHNLVDYVGWLYDLEVNKNHIPCPDVAYWLMSSKSTNEVLLNNRKETDSTHKIDILESNASYLDSCRYTLQSFRDFVTNIDDQDCPFKSEFIEIDRRNRIKTIDEINDYLYHRIQAYLFENDIHERYSRFNPDIPTV